MLAPYVNATTAEPAPLNYDLNTSSIDYPFYNDSNLTTFYEPNVTDLDCPKYTDGHYDLIDFFTFWVEGVANVVIASIGLVANAMSAIILAKEDMRNSFNFLLIALICMDSCYLCGAILEAVRKSFSMATDVHIHLFPYFLYPGLNIAMTGSVFMTVGIALERYIAVHYPIDYSQAINSPEACKRRLFKYVVPVIVLSVFFNLPKFFESEVVRNPIIPANYTEQIMAEKNLTTDDFEHIIRISVTEFRQDPVYTIYYNNWTRLIVIGIVPTALLIYFNYKIYKDVKHRNRRQMSMSRHSATATQQGCSYWRYPVMIVINSSTNMILYIFLNESFRRHCVVLLKDVGRAVGAALARCICCKRKGPVYISTLASSERNVTTLTPQEEETVVHNTNHGKNDAKSTATHDENVNNRLVTKSQSNNSHGNGNGNGNEKGGTSGSAGGDSEDTIV